MPHVHLLLKQVGGYVEWTYTISALSAACKVFGSGDGENEGEGDIEVPTLGDIESFQSFAKFE